MIKHLPCCCRPPWYQLSCKQALGIPPRPEYRRKHSCYICHSLPKCELVREKWSQGSATISQWKTDFPEEEGLSGTGSISGLQNWLSSTEHLPAGCRKLIQLLRLASQHRDRREFQELAVKRTRWGSGESHTSTPDTRFLTSSRWIKKSLISLIVSNWWSMVLQLKPLFSLVCLGSCKKLGALILRIYRMTLPEATSNIRHMPVDGWDAEWQPVTRINEVLAQTVPQYPYPIEVNQSCCVCYSRSAPELL